MEREVVHEGPGAPEDDLRWDLLRRLAERARERLAAGGAEPEDLERVKAPEMAISVTRSEPIGWATGAPPTLHQPLHITIDTDARVPLTFVIAELRAFWNATRKGKRSRERSRRLEERKVRLLEFVCMTHPDRTWRERFDLWERAERTRRRRWKYDSLDRFITECHTAEEQLTGSRSGLRWFYDAAGRMTKAELRDLAKQGDQDAQRELERRQREGDEAITRAGIKLDRYGRGGKR